MQELMLDFFKYVFLLYRDDYILIFSLLIWSVTLIGFLSSPKDMLIDFRERKERSGGKGKKHQCEGNINQLHLTRVPPRD